MNTRLPPHSLEAEQGALGCCLLSPQESIDACIGKLEPNSFYDQRHQVIFQEIIAMTEAREPVDLITIGTRLRNAGQLQAIGDLLYLSQLQDATPSAANVSYYVEIIREKYAIRKTIATASEIIAKAYDCPAGQSEELLDMAEKSFMAVASTKADGVMVPIKTLMRGSIDRIEEQHRNGGKLSGLPSGFGDFDKLTRGLQNGEMIVLAARPSMGKTSLAMNFAEHVATTGEVGVGVFSLEMTKESLSDRLLCSSARYAIRSGYSGEISEGDVKRLTAAAAKLGRSKLHIDDTPALSVMQIRSRARRMHSKHGCRLFVIDYLQLIRGGSNKSSNREREVAEISSGIKALAKELMVPIIVLCQLNRDVERDKNRKPRLSDLRESGSIEQDADLVLALHKPEDSIADDPDRSLVPVEMIILKQRNGPTGEVPLMFNKNYTRFTAASKIHTDE